MHWLMGNSQVVGKGKSQSLPYMGSHSAGLLSVPEKLVVAQSCCAMLPAGAMTASPSGVSWYLSCLSEGS